MGNTAQTYADVLKSAYEKRKSKNPAYSLRAFARDIGVSVSTASLLLRARVGLSLTRAKQISQSLGFSPEEEQYFVDLVLTKCGRSAKSRDEANLRLRQYDTRFTSMSIKDYQRMAAWYALPTMELIRIHGPAVSSNSLAQRLGISEKEVDDVRSILRELGVLQKTAEGDIVTKDFIVLPDGPKDDAIRLFHNDILERAKIAVNEHVKEERNIGCAIVRLRKSDIEWVAKEMRIFRRKLAARIEAGTDHDTVAAISTQLFRLDHDI